jgi:hypothetical protein
MRSATVVRAAVRPIMVTCGAAADAPPPPPCTAVVYTSGSGVSGAPRSARVNSSTPPSDIALDLRGENAQNGVLMAIMIS